MDTIRQLLYKHSIGTLTAGEEERLRQWAGDDRERLALLSRLGDKEYVEKQLWLRCMVDPERPLADMKAKIGESKQFKRLKYSGFAAAAAIVLLLVCGAIWYMTGNVGVVAGETLTAESETPADSSISLKTILPGSTYACLTNSKGEKLDLSASDTVGVIIAQKTAAERPTKEIASLKLDVPRGAEFKIVLEDSTEVWLNSESVLSYPEMFDSDERRVAVVGEAYFEVREDATRPFIVDAPGQTVKVYGTAFNIRAYPDEKTVFTTLERGSISVARPDGKGGEIRLSPGHQSVLNATTLIMKTVKPETFTGWRHGRFVFEDQPLSAIMRDLARWYDIEYEFADATLADIVFMGSIPRYSDFGTAIAILEKSGGIRFTTEGRKVIISR